MMAYWISKIAYNLTWIPWYLLFRFFLNYKIIYKDRSVRKLRGPLIIAANHSSWLDPFLLSGIFPIFSPIFPIRFATLESFFRYIHTALFVRIYGSFPVRRGVGIDKVLAPAVNFLSRGQVVGIFPEGGKRHLGRPRRGRRGVAYLAIKTGAPILPCRIEGILGLDVKNFLGKKRDAAVHAGEPFRLPKEFNDENNIDQLNKATAIIGEKIQKL